MAGAVQWTINQLWTGIQTLYDRIKQVEASLNQDKDELTALYSYARQQYEPAGAHDRSLIEPLIHQNSVLRLTYLAPIKAKYVQAAKLASDALKRAGYTTPGLSGMGAVLAIAPAAAVVIVIAALASVATVALLTQAQRIRTSAIKALIGDPNATPTEKAQLLQQIEDELAQENKGRPFNTDWIVPAIGLVALILLGPQLMRMVGTRRAQA